MKIKKVMKEDIENLERYIGNAKVGVHTDLPIVMADAYEDSKKRQEEIDKEIEEKNKNNVKLNKVLGAEKQPVPKMPEEAKINLEESLFEDYDEKFIITKVGENNYSLAKGTPPIINSRINIEAESPEEAKEILKKYGYKDSELVVEDYKSESILKEGMYYDENSFIPTLKDKMVDLGIAFDDVAELVNSAYFNGEEINNLFATNYPFQMSFDELAEEVGAWVTYFIEGLNNKEYNYEECLKEGRKSDPFVDSQGNTYSDEDRSSSDMDDSYKDIYTIIFNELSPEHSNWMKKTKVKDIPMKNRYDAYSVGTDMDDNIIVHADSEEDFELARRVADAYGLEFREPKRRTYDRDLTATIVMPK